MSESECVEHLRNSKHIGADMIYEREERVGEIYDYLKGVEVVYSSASCIRRTCERTYVCGNIRVWDKGIRDI